MELHLAGIIPATITPMRDGEVDDIPGLRPRHRGARPDGGPQGMHRRQLPAPP
jgi:hypothetical protein